MFCLNFLPYVGEKRLATLNVEASDNVLVSIHFFTHQWPRNFFVENCHFLVHPFEFTVRPLTDTVSRSIDGPDMTSGKPIANLCLYCYFLTCSTILKNPLKWLAEEMI